MVLYTLLYICQIFYIYYDFIFLINNWKATSCVYLIRCLCKNQLKLGEGELIFTLELCLCVVWLLTMCGKTAFLLLWWWRRLTFVFGVPHSLQCASLHFSLQFWAYSIRIWEACIHNAGKPCTIISFNIAHGSRVSSPDAYYNMLLRVPQWDLGLSPLSLSLSTSILPPSLLSYLPFLVGKWQFRIHCQDTGGHWPCLITVFSIQLFFVWGSCNMKIMPI